MKLTANQKSGLRMLARGHKPRQITIEALFDRGLVTGSIYQPKLTDLGRYVEKHGAPPES